MIEQCERQSQERCNHADPDYCCGGGSDGPCTCNCHAAPKGVAKKLTVYGPDVMYQTPEPWEPIDPDGIYYSRGEADAEIARLKAAVPEWQPIDRCPKDGTSFLVCNGNWMTVAHWHRQQKVLATNGPTYERYPNTEQPTHWMPLPEAPSALNQVEDCD